MSNKQNALSKLFASFASACEEQAQKSLSVMTDETSAEQAKRTKENANNLARVSGVNKASTSHAEELHKLSALVSDSNVAKLFKECAIDSQAIASLSKYNKAKINATFAKIANDSLPDWTRNHENAFAVFELFKKQGNFSVNIHTLRRFLNHEGLTQARSYIANMWKALGVCEIKGSKDDAMIVLRKDSKLAQRICKLYAIDLDASEEQA